jgi:DNA modification methylase
MSHTFLRSAGPHVTILTGDCRAILKTLPEKSVHCCVTSPPYFGLRDYGVDGQLGLERTPDDYVQRLVRVFRRVRRVLREDGTLWVVLGDSYAANRTYQVTDTKWRDVGNTKASVVPDGLKPKDLIGIPWRVAFALQADGWYLRSDIIWHKPNPMPESVTDRPTKAHEYLFLFAKSQRYYYNGDAVKEPLLYGNHRRTVFDNTPPTPPGQSPHTGLRKYRAGNLSRDPADGATGRRPADHRGQNTMWEDDGTGRNRRTVWTVSTKPYRGAHFACFPPALIRPCVLAGCPPSGTVLDPFAGSGTTGQVAKQARRHSILIELNPKYIKLIRARTRG